MLLCIYSLINNNVLIIVFLCPENLNLILNLQYSEHPNVSFSLNCGSQPRDSFTLPVGTWLSGDFFDLCHEEGHSWGLVGRKARCC